MLNMLTPLPVVGGVTQDEGSALGASLTVLYDDKTCTRHKVQPSEHEHVAGVFLENGVTTCSLIPECCAVSILMVPSASAAEPQAPAF